MEVGRLNVYLQDLISSYNSQLVRDAIETLLKIHRNIYFNKDDLKYKKLHLHNQVFCNKVWDLKPAQHFMIHCGWRKVDGTLYFENDGGLLQIINVLLEHRYMTPEANDWKPETKIENLFVSKKREEMLRAKAAAERDKELADYKKEEKYRKQLAENIKKQIADDRKCNRNRFTKPVAGNKLNEGKARYLTSARHHLHNSGEGSFRRLGD